MSEQPDGGHGYQWVANGIVFRVHTECKEGQTTRIVVEEQPQQIEMEASE